ncbi:MAG: DUF1801 domain-containing protein [Myxococcota bacterium]
MQDRAKPQTFDDYLAPLVPEKRAALEALRQQIRAAAPHATECISYGLPAFRDDGYKLVAIGAAAKHCALYPMSAACIDDHAAELADFDTSKGTIRFHPDRPLPAALVAKLVHARLAENAVVLAARASRKRPPRAPAKP